ncbi:hypothetical protein [Streptomyces sp. NPDC001568]|uniref:hypothetical protein n=1 Tax=Streptomyces sp. NPDC001568 TaxID=3364588 RepID=UPI00368D0BAC
MMWLLGIPALVLGGLSAIVTLALLSDGTDDPRHWLVVAALWIVSAVFLIPWGVCLRRRHNGLGRPAHAGGPAPRSGCRPSGTRATRGVSGGAASRRR